MKSVLKKLNILVLFIGMLGMVTFMTSCEEEDPCETVTCENGGTCIDGTCDCPDGYEGDDCSLEWVTKFLGTNMATQDTCYGDNGNFSVEYNMSITKVSTNEVSTTNLGAFGGTNVVTMNVVSSNDLSINYTDVLGRVFSGNGSISDDVITIDYVVEYSDQTRDTCIAIITK